MNWRLNDSVPKTTPREINPTIRPHCAKATSYAVCDQFPNLIDSAMQSLTKFSYRSPRFCSWKICSAVCSSLRKITEVRGQHFGFHPKFSLMCCLFALLLMNGNVDFQMKFCQATCKPQCAGLVCYSALHDTLVQKSLGPRKHTEPDNSRGKGVCSFGFV